MKKGGVTTARSSSAAITKEELRRLRNDVPIEIVVQQLRLERRMRGRRHEFHCTECGGFHGTIHEQANLARCFRCARNYNPIDLIMAVRRASFLEAVYELREIDRSTSRNEAPTQGRTGERSSK